MIGLERKVYPSPTHGAFSLRQVVVWFVGFAFAIGAASMMQAQTANSACGSLDNGNNGPFDYLVERGRRLSTVEEFHFTPGVESLIRGQSGSVGQDLDYTLSAFPNHHRALMAIMRLGEKTKSSQPPGARYTVECYFQRAIRLRRDDTIARMIYATFLAKASRAQDAVTQLEVATTAAADNPFSHNNIGLVYFDLKEYDKALRQAHKAISLGFVQTTLREQLTRVGKWSEPAATAVGDTAIPAPAPTAPKADSN